jgi:hypothetical protein
MFSLHFLLNLVHAFISTLTGTNVQDIHLRLNSLPPPRGATSTRLCFSNAPGAPELVLTQLADVRNLVNQSLDVVDVSTWTGDPFNASFISGQLRLLYENIAEARSTLKGEAHWWESSADDNVCELFLLDTEYRLDRTCAENFPKRFLILRCRLTSHFTLQLPKQLLCYT